MWQFSFSLKATKLHHQLTGYKLTLCFSFF